MWLLAISFTILLVLCSGETCSSSRYKVIKISFKSERNETGHWNAEVELQHGAGKNQPGPWVADVEHITEQCGDAENIIIVANLSAPPQTSVSARIKPGPDYEEIPRLGYYKFHPEVKTWFQARDICVEEGGHLVVINSEREAKALLHFWTSYPKIFDDWRNLWAHIGFHDQYVEGEYVTIFGDPLASSGYEVWYPGQPDKVAHENCGAADRSASLLGDVGCEVTLPFFCEQEL